MPIYSSEEATALIAFINGHVGRTYRRKIRSLTGEILLQGVGELSWVVSEHVAGGAGELSVAKGQQVEVLEPWSRADWWLVRAPGEPPQEGAVPAHVLKPQPTPQTKTSPSRRSLSQPAEEPIGKSSSSFFFF